MPGAGAGRLAWEIGEFGSSILLQKYQKRITFLFVYSTIWREPKWTAPPFGCLDNIAPKRSLRLG